MGPAETSWRGQALAAVRPKLETAELSRVL
jgi:hypothetical protein